MKICVLFCIKYCCSHSELNDRMKMDRRRLEAAHLRFSTLLVAAQFDLERKIHSDSHITLSEIMPIFYDAFKKAFASKLKYMLHVLKDHKCKFPRCGKALVLDGNMKNQRDVCMAKDAGFAEFTGLPGKIKTGCTHTPAFKNRFCESHLNHSVSEMDSTSVLEVILDKKTTRNGDYYQVGFVLSIAFMLCYLHLCLK